MKGLEISEVRFSDLNFEKRFDAEYFKKEYLNEDLELSNHETNLLGSVSFVTDGQHGYYKSDPNSKIHMLAARNCKDFFANIIDAEPLAKWVDDNNKRSSLQNKDIVLSTRGSVGCCAIVYNDVIPANINQDVARIKLENTEIIPEFLIIYLNTKYGQNWMIRNQTGMVQQGLPLDKVRQIPIPLLSIDFQHNIERIVQLSYNKLTSSKQLYSEAESLLLSELGLKDWQPKNDNVSIKSFSDFNKTGRLDAEYYQNKYDELFGLLRKNETNKLGKIVNIKKSIEPGSDAYNSEGIPFIRVSNVSKLGLSQTDVFLDEKEYFSEDLMPKKDTILFSKDGSIGIAYKVEKDIEAITSGALLHLKIKDERYLPDYLTLVLNSVVVRLQSERDAGGSIIQHWKPSEIEEVIIPRLPMEIQHQISLKIQESFALQSESKKLLEEAKMLVEREIEK